MLKSFLIAFVLSVLFDFFWIGLLMAKFYQKELGGLLRTKIGGKLDPILWPAILVYVLLGAGVSYFTLPLSESLIPGFLFGVIVYGVYEFTNYSLVKNWSLKVVVVDVLWGGVLCMLVTEATRRILI